MKNSIVVEVYDFLRKTGLVTNESEFSEYWLGHSECYFRTLRFRKSEPSMGSIAICASRLQRAGEQMIATSRYRHTGHQFIAYSEKCHAAVNETAVELDLGR